MNSELKDLEILIDIRAMAEDLSEEAGEDLLEMIDEIIKEIRAFCVEDH